MSGKILSPSYVSLQFVLLKGGVIFQYSEEITCVGLLSRRFVIDSNSFTYRKIKDDIFYNDLGIIKENNYTIATTERALLDLMYLFGDYHFDNLMGVNWDMCFEILPIYDNKSLEKRVIKLHERVTKDA